jgi:hypothetical protein
MTKGVILFAHNNDKVDYVKQAIFCAKQIKKHLALPVTLITSDDVLQKNTFDQIINIKNENKTQRKNFNNGKERHKLLWSNLSRPSVIDYSPYDQTIVMDTDFVVCNSNLLKVFESTDDFLINYDAQYIDYQSEISDNLQYISDSGLKMCWATVFYFKKTNRVKKLFTLINHIKNHWNFYRFRYQIDEIIYRNDFAFSIALHMMNGFMQSDWPKQLPIKLLYILDKDLIESFENNQWVFKLHTGLTCKIQDTNIHIMNKISLNQMIDANG